MNTSQKLKLTSQTVDTLADFYHEPDWMRVARQEAWDLYQALPLPTRQEEAWRRTSLREYPFDTAHLVLSAETFSDLSELPTCWHRNLAPEDQVSGTLVHCNGAGTYQTLRKLDKDNGVIFEDLHQALASHSELIRAHWMRGSISRPEFNKFTALNAALWHGGTFLYVPADVRVSRPLQSLVSYDHGGGSGLHHTLVIAEKGSHVSLIQDRVSQDRRPELNAEIVEVYAAEGAWVRYVNLQHWGNQRYSVSVQDVQLMRDTNFIWVNGALGGKVTKEFLRSTLNAPGARSLMYGFVFGEDDQHVDQSTYQHHRAPDTYSDLLFRNVLQDEVHTVFYGMIRVEPEAARTEGYQSNNNLLLSDTRAHAIPGLEIRCDDVRCSHGATLTHIDPDQRFYLQARGLRQPDAERLVVRGFLQPIVERVPLAHLRERLDEEIALRFK